MRSTRRGGLRTALAILAAVVVVMGGVGLLARPLTDTVNPDATTASPGGAAEARPASHVLSPPGTGLSHASAAPRLFSTETAVATGARFQATQGPQPGSFVQAEASRASPPWGPRLPSPLEELAPDGLPVSGLRCTRDGGIFSCGSCRTDGDCPPGQGCAANRRTRHMECMSSECEADAHCFPGFVCRAATAGTTGPTIIRRCVPEGQRREGEHCDVVPLSPAGTCAEGLVCLAGVCGVQCRREDPWSCPAGYSCEDSLDGAGCYPDCRKLGCPEGQRCKDIGGGDHQCLASIRGDCPESPCGEGERCNMFLSRDRGQFWCARVCNPRRADNCPAGQVCGMGSATVSTCYRKCDLEDPDSCGAGWHCGSVSEDMSLWGCRPNDG